MTFIYFLQLAVEYENNALFVKVDTDDEYEFARDMQVNGYSWINLQFFFFFVVLGRYRTLKQLYNWQVRGLPTLYFISPDPNKDAIRTEGLVPPEMIKNIIDNEM